MRKLKHLIRAMALDDLRYCGTTLVDAKTGLRLGRAFLFQWRRTIKIIRLETPVIPAFPPHLLLTH